MFTFRSKPLFFAVGLLALSGCAAPVQHATPSGKTETTFNAPVDHVKPALVNMMTDMHFTISKDSNYQMSFDKPTDNIMAAALLGSRMNAIPNIRATFTFAPVGNQTRVVMDYAVVTNPGTAFEQVNEFNNNQDTLTFQMDLDGLARVTN